MSNQEIERKFLVSGEFLKYTTGKSNISQGFLSSTPERTVRIRIRGDKGYLTIKGKSSDNGVSRYEFEKEIPLVDAEELIKICEPGIIEKTRYIVPEESGLFFEVDQFYGENKGLIVAEIELPSEETSFTKPAWLGKEVTGDIRFYNSVLKEKPYTTWDK